MMTLPATYNEVLAAEALAFAQDWIKEHRDPYGAFHPDSEKRFGKPMMKWFAQTHPFGCDDIVYFAESGSQEADRALRELIAERTDKSEPLGAVLGAYNIRLLKGLERKPGPAKTDHFVRDIGVVLLVEALHKQFGLRIHKNPASARPTATSIAAQALTEAKIGIAVTHKAVAKIWDRYAPILSGQVPAGYFGPFG
jgi:hypothetical protein